MMETVTQAAVFLSSMAAIVLAAVAIGSVAGRYVAVRRVERAGIALKDGTLFDKYRQIEDLAREDVAPVPPRNDVP